MEPPKIEARFFEHSPDLVKATMCWSQRAIKQPPAGKIGRCKFAPLDLCDDALLL
jgi:hypothetical protein